MSWLDFANHFLSNQRLHAWSWINRTLSWEWFVSLWEFLALSVLGLFLFCFCLVWGEQATDAQDFGWQSKGEDHFRSWFPFFSCLLWWQFCIVQILSGPKTFLYISSVFFRSLIENFLSFFCFLPLFDWEFSLFVFSRSFDWEFSLFVFSRSFDWEVPFFFVFFWGQGLW